MRPVCWEDFDEGVYINEINEFATMVHAPRTYCSMASHRQLVSTASAVSNCKIGCYDSVVCTRYYIAASVRFITSHQVR